MTGGNKDGYKRKGRRMVWGKDKSSDESDEDYMVGEDEEVAESEDEYCSNFDGDESEEILGELEEEEEEEEEEFVVKKVNRVGRPKVNEGAHSRGRKKNGFVKPKRKRKALYREDEDDDEDEDDADYDFDDEKVNKVVKPRKKKRVSYGEEDDEYDGADGDFDDVKVNKVVKPRKKKRVSYREDDDEYDGTDGDFDDVEVNKVVKPREKKRVLYKGEDEDNDVTNDDFEVEKVNKVAKPRKKRGASFREDDDDYDGISDNDDDDEFTPDEIDGVDDEDELPAMTKKKKVGRPRLQGKGSTKRQKRKRNSKVVKKTMRKKPRKIRRPRRKGKTVNDEGFIVTKPIVEENNKKVNGRGRKRRLTIDSDSEFVNSGSSDYEYTISEEEREQIREANEFCRSLTASLRSSNSSIKLEEEKDRLAQRKRPARKGKEKVDDLNVDVGKQVCGICLTEEGKRTVRGTLNCCSHYFCFACIMEWSKVESRCPLCKQRFVTISKPARSNAGFDLRTVVIQIPERDQVYQPSEEELQSFLVPYDDVICTECHRGGDDALMLLCDLCDSPAHTYCVGLGHEVPEGNWYCESCRPTALGSSNPQVLTPTPDYRTNSNMSVGLSSPVSSIRETFDLNEMYVPDTPLTQETSQLPSPRPSVGDVPQFPSPRPSVGDVPQFPSPRPSVGDVPLPSPSSGSGAFTVLERRRIQHQIHQLLNNRRRRMDDRTPETQATVSGHSLFGSQVGRSRELVTQHAVTPERRPSNDIVFHGSLQDNTMPLLQNRDISSARLTHMGGQPCQNQPSTSANRSFSGFLLNEISGLNMMRGLGLDHQQLQSCSSRLNIGSDASMSSFNVEKEQVQSMVKSQLKSLSRDLELGYSTFKDIARCSTHTILAACGVEHRWSEVYPVQTPLICNHIERVENGRMGPARGHCSSCFDLFVRNVVREVMNARVAMLSKT